jgi:hypothetical protein
VHSAQAPLAERVAKLEETQEFRALCDAIERRLGGKGFGSHGWKDSVGNWFRRSGLYHRLATAESLPDAGSLVSGLQAELPRRESIIKHLALIEYVYFHKPRMDFGRYEITRFSKKELDCLLENDIRADFYPWAAVPTSELARYWWLVVSETRPTRAIWRAGRISVSFEDLDIVHRYYTELPPPIEQVLKELALFSWRAPWATDADPRWEPCRIPFCLRVDDHLTTAPSGPRVDTSALETEPEFDHANKEVGERPAIRLHFNEAEADAFERLARSEGTRLHAALSSTWSRPLVEVASNFFAKAFVSDGLEQLLWHITTIEALVGERAEGLTERLARRLAEALGASDSERESIRKRFRELYEFRSELVHGRTPKAEVLTRHLFEAREFARNLLRWYLRLLDDIQKAAGAAASQGDMPDRREILRLLDLETEGVRKARWLLPALPATFPRYPDLG